MTTDEKMSHQNIVAWVNNISEKEILKLDLYYPKHAHRMAHQVVLGRGFRELCPIRWLKRSLLLHINRGEILSKDSLLLVRQKGDLTISLNRAHP